MIPPTEDSFQALMARVAALQAQGRLAEAVRDARAAVGLRPDSAAAWANLGMLLYLGRDFRQAVSALQEALRLDEGNARAWNALGAIHLEAGGNPDAEACFRRAAGLAPDYADARFNLGKAAFLRRHWAEAVEAFEAAAALAPGRVEPLIGISRAHYQCGDVEAALEAAERACRAVPGHPAAEASRILMHNYRDSLSPEALAQAHRVFGEGLARRHAGELPPPRIPPATARLRVGYVAWNWFDHPNLRCAFPVLTAHDPERVEVFCYHLGDIADGLTRRLRDRVEHWRDFRGLPAAEAARRIHADGLHILVGQEGLFQEAVLEVMARRLAPVQAAWSGYPHPWGLPTVDVRITDAVLDPPGPGVEAGPGRPLRLPWFRAFLPPDGAPEPGPLPARRQGHVTFGSFNNLAKISDACLGLWARVLAAVPGSRLALHQAEAGPAQEGLRRRMAAAGLPAAQVDFRPRLREADYLEAHRAVDLLLDTSPYPGVTVSATALWMGVPAVCLGGGGAASREGACQVVAAGFPELVARDGEGFVDLNVRLATDLEALEAFRAGAQARMAASPLLDGAGLARHLEDAYAGLVGRTA